MCVTKIKVKTPNVGCDFNVKLLESVFVSQVNVSSYVEYIKDKVKCMNKDLIIPWLVESVKCIDLTTLGGDDTPLSVQRLCYKAVEPIPNEMLKSIKDCPILQEEKLRVAAICVYPSRLSDAVKIIGSITEINNATEKRDSIQIASVAAGFPSGQYPLSTRLDEIKHCVKCGANEIDVVINRTLVLIGEWEELYNEIRAMKEACGDAKMKTILGVGECGSLTNVYKASLVAMMAGSDFIKTSTGKEAINATLPVGVIMCRAIWDYFFHTGYGLQFATGEHHLPHNSNPEDIGRSSNASPTEAKSVVNDFICSSVTISTAVSSVVTRLFCKIVSRSCSVLPSEVDV